LALAGPKPEAAEGQKLEPMPYTFDAEALSQGLRAVCGAALLALAIIMAVIWLHIVFNCNRFIKPHVLDAWGSLKRIIALRWAKDPKHDRILLLVNERRLHRCRSMLQVLVVLCWPFSCIHYIGTSLSLLGQETFRPLPMSPVEITTHAVHSAVTIYILMRPQHLHMSLLKVAYWYWMVRFVCLSAWRVYDDAETFFIIHHSFVRALFAFVIADSKIVAASHLVCLPCLLVLSLVLGAYDPLFWLHVLVAVLIILCTVLLELREWAEMKALLEASSLRRFESAAESLLYGMCDAVVHLSSSLEIMDASPKLAGLLLQTRSMEGVNFVELLEEGNEPDEPNHRSKFLEFINRPPDAIAGTKYVAMRDSHNTRVPVQVFHAVCWDQALVEGHVHILGIRDIGEEEKLNTPAQRDCESSLCRSHPLPSVRNRPSKDSSDSEDTSAEMHSQSSISTVSADLEVSVWIKIDSVQLEILTCTSGFASLVGPGNAKAGNSFLNLVNRADHLQVEKGLQRYVSKYWNGEDGQCELQFHLRSGLRRGRAVARISIDLDKDDTGETAQVKVVRWKKVKQSHGMSQPVILQLDKLLHL